MQKAQLQDTELCNLNSKKSLKPVKTKNNTGQTAHSRNLKDIAEEDEDKKLLVILDFNSMESPKLNTTKLTRKQRIQKSSKAKILRHAKSRVPIRNLPMVRSRVIAPIVVDVPILNELRRDERSKDIPAEVRLILQLRKIKPCVKPIVLNHISHHKIIPKKTNPKPSQEFTEPISILPRRVQSQKILEIQQVKYPVHHMENIDNVKTEATNGDTCKQQTDEENEVNYSTKRTPQFEVSQFMQQAEVGEENKELINLICAAFGQNINLPQQTCMPQLESPTTTARSSFSQQQPSQPPPAKIEAPRYEPTYAEKSQIKQGIFQLLQNLNIDQVRQNSSEFEKKKIIELLSDLYHLM